MKKIFLSLVTLSLLAIGCEEKTPETPVDPAVKLTVTEIAANAATLTVATEGDVVSLKVVENYLTRDLTFDVEEVTDIKMIQFVEDKGKVKQLPYQETLTRLPSAREYITIVVGYNSEGRGVCYDYVIWESVGADVEWSNDNSAGDLENNKW